MVVPVFRFLDVLDGSGDLSDRADFYLSVHLLLLNCASCRAFRGEID